MGKDAIVPDSLRENEAAEVGGTFSHMFIVD